MTPIDRLNRANEIAPTPDQDGSADDWTRHYAVLAFASCAAFHDQSIRPGPELGYLSLIADASVAAACALYAPDTAPRNLWELSPDGGALNGEPVEWLTATLDRLGINPADIDDRYTAGDFRSPSRQAA